MPIETGDAKPGAGEASVAEPSLLPPEAFDADPLRATDTERHQLVRNVFEIRCAGMTPRPTPTDLAAALDSPDSSPLTHIQEAALLAWLSGATTEEIVRAYCDRAYSMQALVTAMKKLGAERAHDPYRVRTLNTHCKPEWIVRRNELDPLAESRARPAGRY